MASTMYAFNRATYRGLALVLPALLLGAGCDRNDSGPATNYAAEGSVGRWCGKPSNLPLTWQLIEIVAKPANSASVTYGDGSSRKRPLTSPDDDRFDVVDDPRAEAYEIAGTNRDLRVVDQDGLIFIATRMEPSQPSADCLPGQ